jgi:hypothetical protein
LWHGRRGSSGLYQYRYVAPAQNSSPPILPSQGTLVDADISVTTVVMDVSAHQGVLTGFVFSVDNDNDRTGDQAKGDNLDFVVKIDRTPPPGIVLTQCRGGYVRYNLHCGAMGTGDTRGRTGRWGAVIALEIDVFSSRRKIRDPLSPTNISAWITTGPPILGQITNRQSC